MSFSFYKDDKLKFGKVVFPTSELTKYMQSNFQPQLLEDVSLHDVNIKLSESTKLELSYEFTLGHFSDLSILKNALIGMTNDQYPRDIIHEICSFFCVDDFLYKFKFVHAYNCSVVQNLYGTEFKHENEYELNCLNDPKFYCMQFAWNDEHFRALLLSMMCCGYKIIKKSNVLTEMAKKQQIQYIDGPLCQNMELFTKTLHKKTSGLTNFDEIFKGLTLADIDYNILSGLDAAISKSKSEQNADHRSIIKKICEFIHNTLQM